MDDLCAQPAVALVDSIARRELSPVELLEACLARIEAVDGAVNAFCLVADEQARAGAERAEQAVLAGERLGPLHGLPIAIKDAATTAGMRTTFGSRAWADFVPREDNVVVARLRDAGAVIVGKTATPEFGVKGICESPLLGRTSNPWDLTRTSGGSSGGSAAAVAAGMVPLAEGSDGAGSIRIPASCCGVVGVKPSFGRLPLHPRNPFETLVHQGPLARDVGDAALMLAAMAGSGATVDEVYGIAAPPRDYRRCAVDPDVRGWRIAYSPDLGLPGVDPEVVARTEETAHALEELGAHVEQVDVRLPDPREPMMTLWTTVYGAIARERVLPRVGREDVDPDLVRLADAAEAISAATYYDAAVTFRNAFFRGMLELFARHRILLTPTLTHPAMAHPQEGMNPLDRSDCGEAERFLGWFRTYHFNLTGQPAVSVPCGSSSDGMPIGLQVVAAPRADADALRAAAACERIAAWSARTVAPLPGAALGTKAAPA